MHGLMFDASRKYSFLTKPLRCCVWCGHLNIVCMFVCSHLNMSALLCVVWSFKHCLYVCV